MASNGDQARRAAAELAHEAFEAGVAAGAEMGDTNPEVASAAWADFEPSDEVAAKLNEVK